MNEFKTIATLARTIAIPPVLLSGALLGLAASDAVAQPPAAVQDEGERDRVESQIGLLEGAEFVAPLAQADIDRHDATLQEVAARNRELAAWLQSAGEQKNRSGATVTLKDGRQASHVSMLWHSDQGSSVLELVVPQGGEPAIYGERVEKVNGVARATAYAVEGDRFVAAPVAGTPDTPLAGQIEPQAAVTPREREQAAAAAERSAEAALRSGQRNETESRTADGSELEVEVERVEVNEDGVSIEQEIEIEREDGGENARKVNTVIGPARGYHESGIVLGTPVGQKRAGRVFSGAERHELEINVSPGGDQSQLVGEHRRFTLRGALQGQVSRLEPGKFYLFRFGTHRLWNPDGEGEIFALEDPASASAGLNEGTTARRAELVTREVDTAAGRIVEVKRWHRVLGTGNVCQFTLQQRGLDDEEQASKKFVVYNEASCAWLERAIGTGRDVQVEYSEHWSFLGMEGPVAHTVHLLGQE